MSEQVTERETPRQRREREAAEAAAAAAAGQDGGSGDGKPEPEPEPDLDRLATLDESADDLSEADKTAFAKLSDKQRETLAELREVAAIAGFSLAGELGEGDTFAKQTTPLRNRKPVQVAMDRVAAKAYADWIAAGRPTTWSRMPVITYFIDPGIEDGHGSPADYRRWIRAAVKIIPGETYEKDGKTIEPTGVRARFGADFPLTEAGAKKIGKPEHAGKTVLAWAAVDKRHVASNGDDD
jgi:hypothetical protein